MSYLIGLDLDGTLLTDTKDILDRDREQIILWLEKGYHVVIVTGRRYRSALEILNRHDLFLPIISNNGSVIRDVDESIMFRDTFRRYELKKIFYSYPYFNIRPVFHVDGYDDGYDMAYFKCDETKDVVDYCADGKDRTLVLDTEEQMLELDHLALVFTGNRDDLFSYQNYLNETYPGIFNIHILENLNSVSSLMEVLTDRTNKWNGIRRYRKLLRLSKDKIITVGDDTNDIAMVTKAPYGIAMINGAKPLLNLAKITTSSDNNHGGAIESVKLLLERLAENEN